jgi:hypothetical protein
MFAIETDVPVPARARSGRYPFDSLQPGQSFFVPLADGIPAAQRDDEMRKLARRVSSSCMADKRKNKDRSYRTAAASKDGAIGYRVWRTA